MNGLRIGGLFLLIAQAINCSAHADTNYQTQYNRSLQAVLNNILPNGAVVASPSRSNPNYYYDWVRDTALTMKTLIRVAYDSRTSADMKAVINGKIDTWINWELARQRTPKLTDMGEPRFNVDGTASFDPWGRPQNDAPASRALAGIEIANHWIDEGRLADVQSRLYAGVLPSNTLIKQDLEYVAHHWSDASYDLWEEELGTHFYALTVQKVALLKGAALANRMNDQLAASFYQTQANAIQNILGQFYDADQGIIRFALDLRTNLANKTSPLDIAVVLAAIQTFDGTFYVDASQVRSTLQALISQAHSAFSVNAVKQNAQGASLGVAIGRYPYDIYSGFDFSGGNPWFLATLAAAEFYCDQNQVNSHPASNMTPAAKAQFDRALFHVSSDGSMSEQFNRYSGFEQGANDLTWSHVSYLTSYLACFN